MSIIDAAADVVGWNKDKYQDSPPSEPYPSDATSMPAYQSSPLPPYQVQFSTNGIEIEANIRDLKSADELVAVIDALKVLLRPLS